MRLTVRAQLIFFASLITCVVVMGIIVYTLHFGKMNKFSAYTDSSLYSHQVLTRSIVNPLYFADLKALNTRLKHAQFNPNVKCAVIQDASATIIAQSSRSDDSDCFNHHLKEINQLDLEKLIIEQDHHGLFISQQITMPNNQIIGYLLVGFSLDHLEQSIAEDLRAYLLLALFALLFGIFCAYKLSLYFSQPLSNMVKVSQDIGNGLLNSRSLTTRDDEIGQLSLAINTMAANLKKATVSKDYLDKVINSLGEMLFVIDTSLMIRQVNTQASDVLGYSESELCGKAFMQLLTASKLNAESQESLFQKFKPGDLEVTMYTKSSRSLPVLLSVCTLDPANNESHEFVCIARDITERKQAERDLRNYNAKLASSNQALKVAQEQLIHSAKMASMGQITAGLAHEINQPLGAIQLNAELIHTIASEEECLHENDVAPIYNKIHSQICRIKKIVQHLRIFSRDDKLLEFEETDMIALIDDSLVLFSERFRLKNINLIKAYATNLPVIKCSKIHIEQVLTNLLSNAEHALVKTQDKTIKISAFSLENCIVISVEDNGYGIAESNINKIFDPFFTTKQVGEGTGLGMSISYGIVESHQGRLTVKSELGKGTTFTLMLPIIRDLVITSDKPKCIQGVNL